MPRRRTSLIASTTRGRARRARAGSGAFTLIEVLAAMLIMAVVLPVAMRGVQLALAAASTARHTSEAASLAQSKLNELVVESTSTTSASSGDFSPDHPDYQWTLQTMPRDYGLTEFDLTVTWLERGQSKSLVLTTLSVQAGSTADTSGLGGLQ